MGNANQTSEERESRLRSAAIDRELRQSAREYENAIKILVLGACMSGKSTLVKQMKIIHGDGYSKSELDSYKSVIHSNLLSLMQIVVRKMKTLSIPWSDSSNENHAPAILNFPTPLESRYRIPPEIGESLRIIVHDKGFQECLHRRNEYEFNYGIYYFQEMERILECEYVPTELDVLRSRVQTTGAIETSFRVGKLTYRLFDHGGARSERRKWIQSFDDVRAVIFVAALNGYDMTLFEDGKTNRLEESLNLFQAICNNKFFVKTTIILFLNKMDLFEEKIMRSVRHLRLYFPEYTGPDRNVEAARKFIGDLFLARNLNKNKLIYPHFITATDTYNIRVVLKVVFNMVVRENVEAASLL